MLLTLFRLTMIVPLLVSAVCVEANPDKLSFVPPEENKAVAQSHRQSATFLKQDKNAIHDEDSDRVQKRQSSNNNRYSGDQDLKVRQSGVNSMERFPRSGVLAHKMAKDALKSPKVQETIRKLSRVSSSKGNLQASVKVPAKVGSKLVEGNRHRKGARHKGQKKKKRKRHHRRYRKQHPESLKRGSSKRMLDSKTDIDEFAKQSDETESSMVKRNPDILDENSRAKSSISESSDKVTAVRAGDSDYVDFTSPLNTDSSVLPTKPQEFERSARLRENEKMIDRLMRTTTKDPSKKGSGDQGVEYSDYYSDDEVLRDIAANKIPMQLAESKNPNDRFARQALNFTLYRDGARINRRQSYYPDYDTRRRHLRHKDDLDSLNDFQSYPTNERFSTPTRNSRLFEADNPSFGYGTSYDPPEYQDENSDTSYPGNIEKFPEQPQIPEENAVPELQYDLYASDPNKIQQPILEAQDPSRFNYLNQYETPEERFQSLSSNDPLNSNTNQGVDPRVQLDKENLDQNTMDQPQMEDTRISNMRDEEQEVRTQSNYSPLQLYSNREEQQEEQPLQNFPVQPRYNVPAVSLPNAMDQPLGKILESLGININENSNNYNQNPNLNENIGYNNREVLPYSNTLNQPMEHLISPNYLRKPPKEGSTAYYEGGDARRLGYQAVKSKNRKSIREGHSRRKSAQNGGYDDILTHLEEERNPSHHMNISIAVHDTKEVANQILDTIMEELEDLKEDRSKNNKREGSWSTAQAGMKLDMRVVNRTIIVTLSDLASPRLHESLLNGTWNVSGHAPFKRGSPFTLIATNNNTSSIAVFVGACRVCQGIDTIAGVWSVARQPNGCRDFQVATRVFNDIFRKTKLSSLREKQRTNATESATAKHKKRKS